jgi:hypothetical protein
MPLHLRSESVGLTDVKIKPLVLAMVMASVVSACAPVQPWERGNLAKPQMAIDPNPLQSGLRMHNYSSREAAAAGNAAQGGGCGCY